MEHCENIHACPVVKKVSEEFNGKLDTVADSYEKTQEAIQESSQHLQETNLAIATQTEALKNIGYSLKSYQAENRQEHKDLETEDSALHNRITGVRLDLSDTKGVLSTEIAEKVGMGQAGLAGIKGSLKGKLDWAQVGVIVILLAAMNAFFKYVLPLMGG